jgi:hypothetical protein
MTECEEVAAVLMNLAPKFASYDQAIAYVRRHMVETETVIANTAWALWTAQKN